MGQARPYKNYRWIVADADLLGGKPAIRGSRLSVGLILECLSAGMDVGEINEAFRSNVSAEAILKALAVGAELADKPCVAA